jgi:hypothetical protein
MYSCWCGELAEGEALDIRRRPWVAVVVDFPCSRSRFAPVNVMR